MKYRAKSNFKHDGAFYSKGSEYKGYAADELLEKGLIEKLEEPKPVAEEKPKKKPKAKKQPVADPEE